MVKSLNNIGEKKMTNNDKLSRGEKIVGVLSLWIARLALTTLAVAGAIHLLGGIDPVIAYPFAGVGVAFLLKETL